SFVKKEGIKAEILNKLCNSNPVGIIGVNLDVKKIFSKLLSEELKDGINDINSQEVTGLTLAELEACFSGEVAFAFDGIKEVKGVPYFENSLMDIPNNMFNESLPIDETSVNAVFNVYIGLKSN